MSMSSLPRITKVSQVSMLGVVVLLAAIGFTLNSALDQQDNRSRATSSGNILYNPGCESATLYYKGYQSALSYDVLKGRTGAASCRVTSYTGNYYDIESLQLIQNPQKGQTFTGSAYVRANTNTGKRVFVALREQGGSSQPKTHYGQPVYLTTEWQEVTTTVAIEDSGRTSLLFYVVQDPGSAGDYFNVDDMFFGEGGTAQPTAIPTATPSPVPPSNTPKPTIAATATPKPSTTTAPTQVPTATPKPTVANASPTPTTFPGTITPTTGPTVTSGPTATVAPGSTAVNLTVLLHGIGNGGDSANPNAQGNTNPLRKTRTVTVELFNAQNQLVSTKQGSVTYQSGSGDFRGTVSFGAEVSTGLYTVKLKSDQYLKGLIPGIQSITKGQSNNTPAVTLIAGDVNGDNQINIIDYNLLSGCYSDLLPPVDCNAENAVLTDFNDDGNTNQFDYNLFLRELTNIGGQ